MKACADIRILADTEEAKYPIAQTTTTTSTPSNVASGDFSAGGSPVGEQAEDSDEANLFDQIYRNVKTYFM